MILELLPVEVIEFIAEVVECTNVANLFELRLVCRAFRNLFEPLAFASITFRYGIRARQKVNRRLRALAAGNHPYSQWAQTLRIETSGLSPAVLEPGLDPAQMTAFVDAQKERNLLLKPAIGSLKNLKTVSFDCQVPRDPYNEVLSVLSVLSHLENLSLSLYSDRPQPQLADQVALDKFSSLRNLELCSTIHLQPNYLDAAQQTVAQSSATLELLKFVPNANTGNPSSVWGGPNHDSMGIPRVEIEKLTGNHILPKLTTLIVGADGVLLSAPSVAAFTGLTQLEIHFASKGGVDPSFWDALGSTGIRLDSLCIFPVGKPVSRYLASYSGLKTLRICHAPQHTAPDSASQNGSVRETVDNVFNVVIPRHQEVLRHIAFQGMKFAEFVTDEELVSKLSECKALEVLWLGYEHFITGGAEPWTLDLTVILGCVITGFPDLRYLTMEAIPRNRLHHFNARVSSWKKDMERKFWDAICVAEGEIGVDLIGPAGNGEGSKRSHRRAIEVEWQQ